MMFSLTPTVVHSRSPFDKSISTRTTAPVPCVLAQYAHPEVLELHLVERRILVRQCLSQRGVERPHRALSLGRLDVARALRAHLHGRLSERRLVVADPLLDVHAVALDLEEGLRPSARRGASGCSSDASATSNA